MSRCDSLGCRGGRGGAGELYAEGRTLRQIGAQLDVHWSAVSQQLQRAGVAVRSGGPPGPFHLHTTDSASFLPQVNDPATALTRGPAAKTCSERRALANVRL